MFMPDKQFEDKILSELDRLGLVNEENKGYQVYTIQHKQAFICLQTILTGGVTTKGIFHDTEKLVLYGILSKMDTNRIHTKYSTHHCQNIRDEEDKVLCVLDYECARLTKPDKPLNAYNTIHKLHPEYIELLTPTLERLGLNQGTNIDFDFSSWEQQKDTIMTWMLERNIAEIGRIYKDIARNSINNAMKTFYSLA